MQMKRPNSEFDSSIYEESSETDDEEGNQEHQDKVDILPTKRMGFMAKGSD